MSKDKNIADLNKKLGVAREYIETLEKDLAATKATARELRAALDRKSEAVEAYRRYTLEAFELVDAIRDEARAKAKDLRVRFFAETGTSNEGG